MSIFFGQAKQSIKYRQKNRLKTVYDTILKRFREYITFCLKARLAAVLFFPPLSRTNP
jgi:hypothetical protein